MASRRDPASLAGVEHLLGRGREDRRVGPDRNALAMSFLGDPRDFLARQTADGPPLILVTHQVVINAFAEEVPASGGGSIFALDGTGGLRWITATRPVR